MIFVLLITIFLCVAATKHLKRVDPDQDISFNGLFAMGFGTLKTSSAIIGISDDITVLIIIANIPQLALSWGYVLINRILTGMATSREWAQFGHERTGLRVTCAVGSQKSTYYLQLPYSLVVPQIITSIVVHYIISQSVFPSRIKIYDFVGKGQLVEEYKVLGFSAIAMITAVVLWFLMMASLLALGLVKNKPGIPPAGFCSGATSAACHPPPHDKRPSLRPVMWGEIFTIPWTRVGHCSFTSMKVVTPTEGKVYR